MTTPNDAAPKATQWFENVVEPLAQRVEQHGLGLGVSPARAAASPTGGPLSFAKDALVRAAGIGTAMLEFVSAIAGDVVKIATWGTRSQAPQANPTALFLGNVGSGGDTSTKLVVTNGTDGPYNAVQLVCRGLTSTRGGHLPGSAVSFTPPMVDVAAHGSTTVTMQVEVSRRTRAGNYAGLVEAAGHPGAWIVVTLDVL